MKTCADRSTRHRCARCGALILATAFALTALVRAADDPSRAFRLPADAFDSIDAVRRSVAAAAAGGFEVILAPTSLAPEDVVASFDAIDETLKEAATRKLRVFAWLQVGRAVAADEIPAARDHVLYQHPEWLMVPRELAVDLMRVDLRSPEYIGRLSRWTRANVSRADGMYVSPIDPQAIAFLAGRVTDVLRRYPVHGVHLDALRFPDDGFDYSRRALELFRTEVRRRLDAPELTRMDEVEAIDPFAYPEEFPAEWRRFRQSRLTALVADLRSAIASARPGLVVTAGVIPDAEEALRNHLQDWRTWLDGRFIDAVVPALIGNGRNVAAGAP